GAAVVGTLNSPSPEGGPAGFVGGCGGRNTLEKWPPRSSAAGSPSVAAPARHCVSPVGLRPALQLPQLVARGTQSATNSSTLPTMSKAPSEDTQRLRDPVAVRLKGRPDVLQSFISSSGPGSGGPATAACHSAFDGKRLRAVLH